MANTKQKQAIRQFVKDWSGKHYEKGETQKFWLDLLQRVFLIDNPKDFIEFEKPVKIIMKEKGSDFIDAYIPSTKVLIEQKGSHVDLSAKSKQSDGTELTPYQQGRRYAAGLPVSMTPRWIVACNFTTFEVHDMEYPNDVPELIQLADLEKEYYRLSFLVDDTSVHIKKEVEVSIKAGEIVKALYDKILTQYKDSKNLESQKALNKLCVRLVFCLYAEDAGIFGSKNMFHDYMERFNANDFRKALIELFQVLDTKPEDRDPYMDEALAAFPYVNGGLFSGDIEIPRINEEIRALILQRASDDFDWSQISPTIFGAVFESTLNPMTRRSGGMHYTSIENIHKVIDPLFLDDLKTEMASIKVLPVAKSKREKALAFQSKLASLRFLDPACGSGNFLTESYTSLRRLENEALRIIYGADRVMGEMADPIKVSINQFYGIEINDFACSVAQTALWIAESQMMQETDEIVGFEIDPLPLKTYANIKEGNALRTDWSVWEEPDDTTKVYADEVYVHQYLPSETDSSFVAHEPEIQYGTIEIHSPNIHQTDKIRRTRYVEFDYIMGNPPFAGARLMSADQKDDLTTVFGPKWKNIGNMDYVTGWYKKASVMMKDNPKVRAALVSTNSITQGEQVTNLWKPLMADGIQIDYAWRTFIWDSESNMKAHVHCVIIGFSFADKKDRTIYLNDAQEIKAKNINPYLIDAPNVFIESRKKPVCNVKEMVFGSMPNDGGNFILSEEEAAEIIKNEPLAGKYIKLFLGAEEFINNKKRYCLWLKDSDPGNLRKMKLVAERVEKVRKARSESKREATKRLAHTPWLFGEIRQPEEGKYLLVPSTSSERRRYIPMGFFDCDVISSNANLLVPEAGLYEFGIMTSNVHNAWMRVVCGRLKSDYRYSANIVYNNFPWCNPTPEHKAMIEKTAQAILDARSNHPQSSHADLYDETFMPADLRKAHQENDRAVMAAYGFDVKMTESQCVAELFKLYQELTSK